MMMGTLLVFTPTPILCPRCRGFIKIMHPVGVADSFVLFFPRFVEASKKGPTRMPMFGEEG